jgi:hypothetical protein
MACIKRRDERALSMAAWFRGRALRRVQSFYVRSLCAFFTQAFKVRIRNDAARKIAREIMEEVTADVL